MIRIRNPIPNITKANMTKYAIALRTILKTPTLCNFLKA